MNDNFEVVNLEDKAKHVRQANRKDRKQFQDKKGRAQRGGGQRRRGRDDVKQVRMRNISGPRTIQTKKNTRNAPRKQQSTLLLRPTGRRNRQRQQPKQLEIQEQTNIYSFEPQPNVILKGLGDFMTDQKLREICQAYGALDMCKLDRDCFGQVKPQGIGLVRFERAEDARRIVKDLNGARIVEGQENQSSGGQVSVKYVEPGENYQKYIVPSGVLPIRRRVAFKKQRGSRRNN